MNRIKVLHSGIVHAECHYSEGTTWSLCGYNWLLGLRADVEVGARGRVTCKRCRKGLLTLLMDKRPFPKGG